MGTDGAAAKRLVVREGRVRGEERAGEGAGVWLATRSTTSKEKARRRCLLLLLLLLLGLRPPLSTSQRPSAVSALSLSEIGGEAGGAAALL